MKMPVCPYCKQRLSLKDVKREVQGKGFLKQEIMYFCPYCDAVLGFSRGKYA